MARPKKTDDEKRTVRCDTRMTMAEHVYVQEQAARAGLSVSEYVRRRALGYTVPNGQSRRTDPALISELNRVGQNVNQLARATHTGRDFVRYWKQIGGELETVLERLVGVPEA